MDFVAIENILPATKPGLDLAKRIVDSLPGESGWGQLGVVAKRFGHHANFRFSGVEVSSMYHHFVSVDEDPDKVDASALMRALLSKVELGQELAASEMAFARAPLLALSLVDSDDALCFSLAQVVAGGTAPWPCADLATRSLVPMELAFDAA